VKNHNLEWTFNLKLNSKISKGEYRNAKNKGKDSKPITKMKLKRRESISKDPNHTIQKKLKYVLYIN
jgi:hypothetical protein